MKFVTIEIPVYVKNGIARTPHTLSVELTMSDDATQKDAVEKLSALSANKKGGKA